MSHPVLERLYQLLPATYRNRDAAAGEPLRALMAILEREAATLEEDITRLYDNWFIETCDEWVVPYIGDLLGVGGLHPAAGAFSQRARVANTIPYRRRKGTAAMLEQLSRDVTGWPARVVEFFQLLSTSQHLNHVRPENLRTPDLRRTNPLELFGGPFEEAAHTVEVRRIPPGRGRYNIPNVGIFLWRLQAFPVVRAPAAPAGDGCYRFSQLGSDLHLFNVPKTEDTITELAQEVNVPGPLRRRDLYDDLEALRQAIADGQDGLSRYLSDPPALEIFVDGAAEPIPAAEILIADLSDVPGPPPWRRPAALKTYRRADGSTVDLPIRVAVDPQLGRLSFPVGEEPAAGVHVSYAYGFSAATGGGFYDRRESLAPLAAGQPVYHIRRSDPALDTVQKALAAWAADGNPSAVIVFDDSEIYDVPNDAASDIVIPAGNRLELRAADRQRPVLRLAGPWRITGTPPAAAGDPGAGLLLNGLLITGAGLEVTAGDLALLSLHHCTLVPGHGLTAAGLPTAPGQPSIAAHAANQRLGVALERCMSGPLALPPDTGTLAVRDSMVDSSGTATPAVAAGTVTIERATILGATTALVLELASDTIFTGTVVAARRQEGCVRYSHVPDGSRTPRRFECQPDYPPGAAAAEQRAIALRVRPIFTSMQYGAPGYAQLRQGSADAIARGASDEGEMGAFHHLHQPHREANLRASLDEYLRFGLEAGLVFVT